MGKVIGSDWEAILREVATIRFWQSHGGGLQVQGQILSALNRLKEHDERRNFRGLRFHVAEGIRQGLAAEEAQKEIQATVKEAC